MLDNMDSSSSCKSSTGDQMLSTTSSTARDSLRDSSRSSNPEEGKLHDRAKPKKKSSKKGKKVKKDKDRQRSNSNATNLPTTPPPSSSSLLMSNTKANRTSLREAGAPDVSPIRETDITSSDIESIWAETHLLDEEDEVWYASPSRSSSLLVPSEDLLTTPRVESRVSVGPPAGKLMNGRPHSTTFTTQDTFPLSDGSFGSFRPPQDELPSPNFQTFEHIPSTDTEQPAVHDSKPVSNSGKANRGRSTNRMLKIIATVAVTTLIGILIGVGISVAVHFAIHKDGKGDKAIWQSMNTPTMSPSLAPTSISTEILLAAVELSGADVLADRESPQLKAVAWMSTFDEVYTQGLDHQDFEQRYAFVVMYFSFQGESWLNQEQWLTPLLHECEWSTGIFCESSVSGSPVLGFDATRNNLQGTIPFEIGLLRSCEFYRIGKNSIEGVIPDSIGDMTSLGSVAMSNNMLTGPIPTSLANVRDLKLLDLSNNQLNSSIPVELCNLQFLRTATLKNNRLTGSLVESISNLTSIVTLDLRNNQLSGTVPVSLDSIESLDTLRLDYNRLTGRLPPITSSITLMKSIGLSHNFLSGNIELHPDYKLSTDSADLRLQYIDLSYNLLSGPISSLLGILPSFRHLNLNGNGFVGTFPSSIGWDNIEFLAAANNALTGTVPVGHPTLSTFSNTVIKNCVVVLLVFADHSCDFFTNLCYYSSS